MENLQVADNVIITSPNKGQGRYERKARGSYQNEKKITIKLFQNKRLKPHITHDDIKLYSLYIQVSLKSQTTFFPATGEGGVSFDYEEQHGEIDFESYTELDFQKDNILRLIETLKPFERNDFKVSEVALICTSLYSPIYTVLIKALAIHEFGIDKKDEKEIEKTAHYGLITQLIGSLKEDKEAYSKIDQEFWLLEDYCKLIDRKQVIQETYSDGFFSPHISYGSTNPDLTLIGYLKGNLKKPLINEIGQEKADKIFKSIDFVLETYFCKQIVEIKYIINNFW